MLLLKTLEVFSSLHPAWGRGRQSLAFFDYGNITPISIAVATWICSLCLSVSVPLFLQGQLSLDLGPAEYSIFSSYLDCIYKDPVPKKTTFVCVGLGFIRTSTNHFGGHNSTHDSVSAYFPYIIPFSICLVLDNFSRKTLSQITSQSLLIFIQT